jgi:general secretion pathway protein J
MQHMGHLSRTRSRQNLLREQQGFTLLEVLVAVVIMAVILTTAFGALRLGGRSWEAGITRTSDNETFRTVADLLRRQVSQTIPMRWPDENTTANRKQKIAFQGAPDQLRFVAPAPRQYRAAGLFEYGLAARRQQRGDISLVLSYVPFDPDNKDFQIPSRNQQMALVEGLQNVSFEYYGSPAITAARARTNTEPSRWYQRWSNDAQRFPNLVRIRLQPNEQQSPWPDLYLALPAGNIQ